ncbi:double-strand break repair helicase AddA [Candidatus Synechococcus spongiarum]|uniref:DNA 3'-5' helicase n=1 Tax=Candidatus Synechococcus spongiarum TaxID=431041 RepID=A0A165AGW1_9SYNE|nr:double-strand break repair helicase AddA [Candidatus Synechococcus spongiarum]SAY39387.1 FIG061771: ATP-dependent nuclease subunit A [Candidatus Synechococcus spongiarum]
MKSHPATARQVQASQPARSTWLAANAGSGKTRVLTDRVARLLLRGARPEQILCLTYTRAAAAEMQNRLFRTLGAWAMVPDDELRHKLAALGEMDLPSRQLRHARTLFARAIETPGGLQIQTIHAFCARLLRRFPLEAGVSPQFVEMDDHDVNRLIHHIIHHMAEGKQAHLLAAFAGQLSGEGSLEKVVLQMVNNREDFQQHPLTWSQVLESFSLPPAITEQTLVEQVLQPGDLDVLAQLRSQLARSSSIRDQGAAKKLASLAVANPTGADVGLLEAVLLTGANAKQPYAAKIGDFPTKALRATMASLMPSLEALMVRVEQVRPQRLGLAAAQRSMALHNFAAAFLSIYAQEKQQRGWLDFNDLIQKSRDLLQDSSVADWVLFRLDQGVDHILVDEAQDTSPVQWDVIDKLTQEFSSGEGARPLQRTIFVVGDKKQSIYSFQGAKPEEFDNMANAFSKRLQGANLQLQQLHLEYSFRSAPVILKLVDPVFQGEEAEKAGFSPQERHRAFKTALPGRVDLWPLLPRTAGEEKPPWSNAREYIHPRPPAKVLAKQVATFIQGLMDSGETIPVTTGDGAIRRRAVRPEDVLILVQRRSDLFTEIIAECKARKLPIAGKDRLKVAAELAVKDLMALLRFLATPADDLSLAEALKSPIFGWTEQQLFSLAHHRPPGCPLGQALRNQAPRHRKTVDILEDLRSKTDYLRPYELLERILTRHRARQHLMGRLGLEAEDGIDALLSQALAYETTEIPSLTGFVAWATTDAFEVKRQLSEASDMVRVMTVHGAKGLEAPIVILPDTLFTKRNPGADQLLRTSDQQLLWNTRAPERPDTLQEAVSAQQQKEQEERMRLLYVAMTRSQSWLVVAGAGDAKDDKTKNWYTHMQKGIQRVADAVSSGEVQDIAVQHVQWEKEYASHGEILRLSCGDWCAPEQQQDAQPAGQQPPLPGYLLRPTEWQQPLAAEPAIINPSRLDGDKALPGEAGLDRESAKVRGTAIHRLLETLPTIPPTFWNDVATQLLQQYLHDNYSFGESERDNMIQEAVQVLKSSALAEVFAEEALAEVGFSVTVAGQTDGRPMQGVMDRVLVCPHKVVVIDFKTNATVPATPEDCPEGILRQMGAYRQALAILYPDRPAEAAILWTRTATMMALPSSLLQDAWHRYYDDPS